jgi:hypothetical protein
MVCMQADSNLYGKFTFCKLYRHSSQPLKGTGFSGGEDIKKPSPFLSDGGGSHSIHSVVHGDVVAVQVPFLFVGLEEVDDAPGRDDVGAVVASVGSPDCGGRSVPFYDHALSHGDDGDVGAGLKIHVVVVRHRDGAICCEDVLAGVLEGEGVVVVADVVLGDEGDFLDQLGSEVILLDHSVDDLGLYPFDRSVSETFGCLHV